MNRKPLPIRLSVIGLMATVMTGCAVTPPDTDAMLRGVTPSAWSQSSLQEGGVESFRDFWQRWNDAGLLKVVEQAVSANTDVLTAEANLRSARASLLSANSALWPSATLGTDVSRRRAGGQYTSSYSAEFSGQWTLNLAGSEIWTRDAAEEKAIASSLTLEDVREAVAAEAAQAYVNLRAAQARLMILEQMLKNYVETADTARWQFEAGTGAASEAEDALQQLATAKAQVHLIELSIVQYKNALARLTAQPADKLPIEENGIIPVPPKDCAVSMPAKLLERRPDVRSALHSLASAVATLKSAKSDFFPSLSLSGNIGTTSATVGALGATGSGIAGLAAALSMPILNWGKLIAQEESAAAQLDAARASYLSVLLSALEDADNAISGITYSERRAGQLTQAVEHARAAEMLARTEYETGIGDYTMLLSTQRSLLSSLESEISNRADCTNNYIMLYRAVGGSWAVAQANAEEESLIAADESLANNQ